MPRNVPLVTQFKFFYKDGSQSERVEVNYPIGHRRRRDEGIPVLLEKFKRNLEGHFDKNQVEKILSACDNHADLAICRYVDRR